MMGTVRAVSKRPTLNSWMMERLLLASTITLGGVPIGNRSAREENRVTGASSAMGALPSFGAW